MTTSVLPEPLPGFLPIQVKSLSAIRDFDRSVYLRVPPGQQFRLYCEGRSELNADDFKRLSEAGITTVYLDADDYCGFQDQLRDSLGSIVSDERLSPSQRFSVVNEVVCSVLRETFQRGNVDRAVKQTAELAHHLVELVCRDDRITSELKSVLYFDYSTFTHSANVAYYTLILAHALGQTDQAQLRRIGAGALLHDIGKLGIPEKILLKPGTLSLGERNVIRSHPALGLMNLADQDELEFGQLMMVYQHHERIDGTGYPVRLVGDEIDEWARICAVADVFEALTSHRPYRQPLSTAAALEAIDETERNGLEPEFLQCWNMTISES
jgi:putative nucleotidyltransferase with HDIG domain